MVWVMSWASIQMNLGGGLNHLLAVLIRPSGREFSLQFVTGCLSENELVIGDPVCDPSTVTINFAGFGAGPTDLVTVADPSAILYDNEGRSLRTNPGGLTFVPEPGSLSLILGALGGGWLARRRKKKAAA